MSKLHPFLALFLLLAGLLAAVFLMPDSTAATDICDGVSDIPQAECEGLVALYTSTGGDSWTNHAGWMTGDMACDWYGVTCASEGESRHVVEVNLASNHLVGGIPPEIGNLVELRSLKLYENQLIGNLPPELWNLVHLENLFLSRNLLSGQLPEDIGNLHEIRNLILTSNRLSGHLPASLWNLTTLEVLALSNNQFEGALPAEIANLTHLEGLYLADNRMGGNLPDDIGLLASLHTLDLRSNHFQGEIPFTIILLGELTGGNNGGFFTVTGLNTGYNALYTNNPDIALFMDEHDPIWFGTQTTPPTNVQVTTFSGDTATLRWSPIPYATDNSYYQVYYSLIENGDYTLAGETRDSTFSISGLMTNTYYYFRVASYTPAYANNNNNVTSDSGAVIAAAGVMTSEDFTVNTSSENSAAAAPPESPLAGNAGDDETTSGTGCNNSAYVDAEALYEEEPWMQPAEGYAVVVSTELNVRSEPEYGAERLHIVKYGDVFYIMGRTPSAGWYQFKAFDHTVWADARFMLYQGDIYQIPITYYVNVPYSSLNATVRATPNLVVRAYPTGPQTYECDQVVEQEGTGRIPALLAYNDTVTIIGRTADTLWAEIIDSGIHGWVYSWWLNYDGDLVDVPVTYDSPPMQNGFAAAYNPEDKDEDDDNDWDVNVYMRAGPGLLFEIVGLVQAGEQVAVLDQSPDNKWLKIQRLDGEIGWVFKEYFYRDPTGQPLPDIYAPSPTPLPEEVHGLLAYATQNVNIRTGPGFEYEIIDVLPEEYQVTVIGQSSDGDWIHLQRVDRTTGWAFKEYFLTSYTHAPIGAPGSVNYNTEETGERFWIGAEGGD